MKITRRTEQEINISELKAAIKEGRGLEVIRPHDEITLMMDTGELVLDVGTVLDGESAVKEGLIDELGGLSDALDYLYGLILDKNEKDVN